MNILAKDTKTVYIVPYDTEEEVTKEINGKTIRTGDHTTYYDSPFAIKAYVSSPKGLSRVDINGVKVPEQRTMIIDAEKYQYEAFTWATGATGETGYSDDGFGEADLVLIPSHTLSQSEEEILENLLDDWELSSFAKNNFYGYRISNISEFDYHFQLTITRIDL